jgi:hypothetical protein
MAAVSISRDHGSPHGRRSSGRIAAAPLVIHALKEPGGALVEPFDGIGRRSGRLRSWRSRARLNTTHASVFAGASALNSANHQHKWNDVKQEQNARREFTHHI